MANRACIIMACLELSILVPRTSISFGHFNTSNTRNENASASSLMFGQATGLKNVTEPRKTRASVSFPGPVIAWLSSGLFITPFHVDFMSKGGQSNLHSK